MKIEILPVGFDNYSYLLVGDREASVIDPSEAVPVLKALDRLSAELSLILVTHHHGDHTGGIPEIHARTGCTVAGPAAQSARRSYKTLGEGDSIAVGGEKLSVLHVPGHTRNHVAYYAPALRAVWTGDVLFAGGCGRIPGGAAAEMWRSLQRLRGLPDDTRVFCGHEYTLENLEFAASLEGYNPAVQERLQRVRDLRNSGQPSVPSTIAEEKETNPFLRCDDPVFVKAIERDGVAPADLFAEIRGRKDRW